MRDYMRIAAKIRESIWLCTPDGLSLILDIFNARMNGKLTDEEIALRLEMAEGHGSSSNGSVHDGVGILPIYGPIFGKANLMTEMSGATSLEVFKNDFANMVNDPGIKSIILDIDSPGGTSEMVQTTGDLIFDARERKPIIAVANGNAGSAAYWLGSQASEMYATPDGAVGSVGAYTVHEDQSVADAQQGIKYTFISAGPYKTEGNPHEKLSQEGQAYRQEVINELYDSFLSVVARGRDTDVGAVKANFGGGRMIQASHAVERGMIDGIQEFDAVVEDVSSRKSVMSVPFHMIGERGPEIVQAVFDQETGAFRLESVGMEHSEPGSGNPPTPKPNESDRGAYGSRRGDLPEGFPDVEQAEGAPKANAIGGNMNEEQLKELFALYGVDTEAALIQAIRDEHATAQALSTDIALAGEELRFKHEFPNLWESMQKDKKKIAEGDATKFVESIGGFKRVEGDKVIPTNFGLSALARDNSQNLYMKLVGTPYLSDFVECMTSVSKGIVEYGERGSNLDGSAGELVIDSDPVEVRKQFSALVASKTQGGLSYKDAIQAAAKENPKLAEAYQNSIHVKK